MVPGTRDPGKVWAAVGTERGRSWAMSDTGQRGARERRKTFTSLITKIIYFHKPTKWITGYQKNDNEICQFKKAI